MNFWIWPTHNARPKNSTQMDETIKHLVEKSNALVSEGKRTTHPRRDEERLQESCIKWIEYQYPSWLKEGRIYHSPNGERRDAITGAKLKRMGVVPGVPDLFIRIARHGYHGLYIELKTKKGRLSDKQRQFADSAVADGYKFVVVRSLDEFMKVVKTYLDEKSF